MLPLMLWVLLLYLLLFLLFGDVVVVTDVMFDVGVICAVVVVGAVGSAVCCAIGVIVCVGIVGVVLLLLLSIL